MNRYRSIQMRMQVTWLVLIAAVGIVAINPVLARDFDNLPDAWRTRLDSLAYPAPNPETTWELTQPIHIEREHIRVQLTAGILSFFRPVAGRITGAYFTGEGLIEIAPPTQLERAQLARFTGDTLLQRTFSELYLRFTDSTDERLMAQLQSALPAPAAVPAEIPDIYLRRIERELYYSLPARLMLDLWNHDRAGVFYLGVDPEDDSHYHLFIEPQEKEGVLLYRHPPRGGNHAIDLVCAWPRDEDLLETRGVAADINNYQLHSRHYDLTTVITEPSRTEVTARLHFLSRSDSLRAVRFNLAANLGIDSIWSSAGPVYYFYNNPRVPLDYNHPYPMVGRGGEYGTLDIFWENPLPDSATVTVAYHGRYLLYQFPWGDFYINEPTSWYPTHDWRTRVTFDLHFEHSANREIIAAGEKLREWSADDRAFSDWHLDYPVAFTSFNYGIFDHFALETKENQPDIEVFRGKNHTGSLFNKDIKKKTGNDLKGALELFTNAYGPLPFDHLYATEIPGGHGQGFPQMLHLSWHSFEEEEEGQTELFRAHEVSHQWWGHVVLWQTYHDQWLSEGFAEYSGAWYVEQKYGWDYQLKRIFDDWKEGILEKGGRRAWHEGPEVAPIWLGGRCSSFDSPASYLNLVYFKGAYVVHMLRMMLHDFQNNSDERFMAMMRDFVDRHRRSSATTADFQRVVEDHVDGDMDWFFDQWVYGTEIPRLTYDHEITATRDGRYIVSGSITQSEVSQPFRLFVPVTFEFGENKKSTFLQEVQGWETTFRSPPLPREPRQVIFNDYWTILCYE